MSVKCSSCWVTKIQITYNTLCGQVIDIITSGKYRYHWAAEGYITHSKIQKSAKFLQPKILDSFKRKVMHQENIVHIITLYFMLLGFSISFL